MHDDDAEQRVTHRKTRPPDAEAAGGRRPGILAGDTVQGAEKFWEATSQALKAYSARGLPHGKYQHRRHALLDLADSTNDPFLRIALGTARSCHANFYNDWMEEEELEGYLPGIQAFVNHLLETRADPPAG